MDENDKKSGIYISNKKDIKKFNSVKDIFVDNKWTNQELSNILMVIFFMFSFWMHLVMLFKGIAIFNIYWLVFYYYILFSLIILSFYYNSLPLNINLWTIVFLPFFIIFYLFKFIYSYFNILFF